MQFYGFVFFESQEWNAVFEINFNRLSHFSQDSQLIAHNYSLVSTQ